MTDYTWVGDGGTNLASTATCWNPNGVPGSSDNCLLTVAASRVCNFNVAQINHLNTTGFTLVLTFNNHVALAGFTHDCEIACSSKVITFAGTPVHTNHFIKIGANASYTDITQFSYILNSAAYGSEAFFDTGQYPQVALVAGKFTPQYLSPTVADSTNVQLQSLSLADSAVFKPNTTAPNANDRLKVFEFKTDTNLVCVAPTFDGGKAKWMFLAKSSGYSLPTTGNSGFGSSNTFTSSFEHIEISAATGGHFCSLVSGARLVVTDLTINVGASIIGPTTGGATILCINRPTLKGTWGFTQIADGVYSFPKDTAVTNVANGGTGNLTLASKSLFMGNGNYPMTALAIGTANQVLSVNSSANNLEWTGVDVPHTAHISLSASIAPFASGAYTICPLNTADFDTASKWDNTNRCYVIPRTGKYLISYSAAMRHITTSHVCIAQLKKEAGGSGGFSGAAVSIGTNGRNSGDPSGGTIVLSLSADDRIALYCYHNGGGGKNLIGDAVSEGLTFLSIAEIA